MSIQEFKNKMKEFPEWNYDISYNEISIWNPEYMTRKDGHLIMGKSILIEREDWINEIFELIRNFKPNYKLIDNEIHFNK